MVIDQYNNEYQSHTVRKSTIMEKMKERVKSKNLFNFKPQGRLDEDIEAFYEKGKVGFTNNSLAAWSDSLKKMSEEDFVRMMRQMMDKNLATSSMVIDPALVEAFGSCNHSELHVPTSHDGHFEVPVLVHVPKFLADDTKRPCIIYAHGGGCVGGSASIYSNYLSYMALTCGVVIFNVDYRLAPETRCPNNVLDFYEVIKYVSSNSKELGVDASRIAMAGDSGGGYVCAGAMVQLASKDEGDLVKLAVPIIAILDDYEFTSRESMMTDEAERVVMMQKIWQTIGGPDFEAKQSAGDPLLFPGKADASLLARMPPTIIWESEFDQYLTPTTRFASKLRAAGRLLELVVIPGGKHGSGSQPHFNVWRLEREAWRFAIQEYLVKE